MKFNINIKYPDKEALIDKNKIELVIFNDDFLTLYMDSKEKIIISKEDTIKIRNDLQVSFKVITFEKFKDYLKSI